MTSSLTETIESREHRIDRIAFGGQGVCRHDDFVIFVKGAVPGDQVRIKLTKRKKSFAEAVISELIRPSGSRVQPVCPHFGVCGGCTFQHVAHDSQLEFKRQMIADVFERIGGLSRIDIPLPVSSGSVFRYRNKMEFTFNDRAWLTTDQIADTDFKAPDFALGLHVPGRFDKVLPIRHCYLQSERANRILNIVDEFTRHSGLPPYSATEQVGFWRFLVIREFTHTNELMAHIITYNHHPDMLNRLRSVLCDREPGLTSLIHSVNSRKSQVAVGDETFCLHGSPVLTERLLNNVFCIDPHAFFQTNTGGAELLYKTIIDLAGFQGHEKVLDLYCGTGSIAICIAPYIRHVTGIELIEEAVGNAKHNAELNTIPNCTFMTGDIKDSLKTHDIDADIIILDPPRSGLHPDAVSALIRYRPEKIIYVSCNPSTQARDLQLLTGHYEITAVQPVDMFPQTYHVENVAVLKRLS